MWQALDSYRDISVHLSALLIHLQNSVQAIVEIASPIPTTSSSSPSTSTTQAAAAVAPAAVPNTASSMKAPVSPFWAGVLREVESLSQKLCQAQRAHRSAYLSRITPLMEPPQTRPFLRRPRDVTTARIMAVEPKQGKEVVPGGNSRQSLRKNGCASPSSSSISAPGGSDSSSSEDMFLRLDSVRTSQVSNDLRHLWAHVEVVMGLIRKGWGRALGLPGKVREGF